MNYKYSSLVVLLILISGSLWTPGFAQGGITVSLSVPSNASPNTPVTLTAEVLENGTPKSGVNVAFSVDGAGIGDCTTDVTGKCQIGHIFSDPGEYTVSATAEGSSSSDTIVVGTPSTATSSPPTRTPTPTRTNTRLPPTITFTALPAQSDKSTPTRTPFFFNPSRTPTATRTPTPLFIPSSTATSDLFMATPRITTATPAPTRTPRPTTEGILRIFATLPPENGIGAQENKPAPINVTSVLNAFLVVALVTLFALILVNFRRFRKMLRRLFRF